MSVTFPSQTPPAAPVRRNPWRALLVGFGGCCPNCGKGRLFRAFLKVDDACPACAEPLHHHRADDAPAYFVILIVGHIVVPLALAIEVAFAPPYAVHFALWPLLTLGLALGLLQPVKGAIVGWQWAHRMHGFDPSGIDAMDPLKQQPIPGRQG